MAPGYPVPRPDFRAQSRPRPRGAAAARPRPADRGCAAGRPLRCGPLGLLLLTVVSLGRPAAAQQTPVVRASGDGFVLRSADGEWRLRLGGYFQADTRIYPDDPADALATSLLIRRARPYVDGTVSRFFDFRIMPDFGSGQPTIFEAWLEARFARPLSVRVGKFKPPVGLERLQSATDLRFIERGFPTNLAPNRDVGVQVAGELANGVLSYQAGVFNGVPDLGFGDGDTDDAKDVAARVFLVPFAGRGRQAPIDLGVGIAGSAGREHGTVAAPQTSNLRSPGQAVFFRYRTGATPAAATVADGRRSRVYPQGYLYHGPFGLLVEYVRNTHTVRRDTEIGAFHHRAWQVAASVLVTGERASYRTVTPTTVFDPHARTWGALELTARVQGAEVDDAAFPFFADPAVSARRVRAYGVGVTWYLARHLKTMLNVEHASFRGGAPAGDRPAETFVATRVQFAY